MYSNIKEKPLCTKKKTTILSFVKVICVKKIGMKIKKKCLKIINKEDAVWVMIVEEEETRKTSIQEETPPCWICNWEQCQTWIRVKFPVQYKIILKIMIAWTIIKLESNQNFIFKIWKNSNHKRKVNALKT